MLKITDVQALALSVPVTRPTRMATRLLDRRDYLVVEIRSDDSDAVGVGYSYAGTIGGKLLACAVEEVLAPVVLGANAEDITELWSKMYQESLLIGRRGVIIRSLSAIDIALWDLAAKRAGVPLTVALGSSAKAVPAYASGGYYRPDEGPWVTAVEREMAMNRAYGFTDHKIKVGGLSVSEDAARVAAAIGAIGDSDRLALDANNAYKNVPEALQAIRAFERAAGDHGLWWVEEPLSPDDIAGHAQLATTVESPIATGEIAQTRWEFRSLLGQAAAHILQPDAGVLGGVTEWMRVAHAADTFGVPVAPHWHTNLHVHLAAATANCIGIEHFILEKDIYNFELLLVEDSRLDFGDGTARISDRPGIGIEFDKTAIDQYRVR